MTCTAGAMAAPAVVEVGCTVNTNCEADPGVMSNAALPASVKPVAVAVSV